MLSFKDTKLFFFLLVYHISVSCILFHGLFPFYSGIGLNLIETSNNIFIQQRFHKNRNLATFISYSAYGVGAALAPLWAAFLMSMYGWRGLLIVHSGIMLNCFVCSLFLRSPAQFIGGTKSSWRDLVNFSLLRHPTYLVFCVGMTLFFWNNAAFFRHIVSRAMLQLNVSRTNAAMLATLFGGTIAVARFTLGFVLNLNFFSARKPWCLSTLTFACGLAGGLGTWFLAKDYTTTAITIVIYAAIQGTWKSSIL